MLIVYVAEYIQLTVNRLYLFLHHPIIIVKNL